MTQCKKKGKKNKERFNPNHAYVQESMRIYLENGGKITRIQVNESTFKDFISMKEYAEDDFLREGY